MKRWRIVISGEVQGVFYRASAQRKASELGITGWARNKEDGTVEIEAQGTLEILNTLVKWCHEGPPDAEVEKVRVEKSQPLEGEREFVIRR